MLDLLSPGIASASEDLKELFHLTSAKCPTAGVKPKHMWAPTTGQRKIYSPFKFV